MKTRFFVWLITGVALLSLSGCSGLAKILDAPKPSASLLGVTFGDISLKAATLVFDVEVENPYSTALPLTDIDYDVTSSDNRLFKGQAAIAGSIPAKGTKTVSLPATIEYSDVIRAFKDVRPGSEVPYDAQVGLSVTAPVLGLIRIPINRSGELKVPTIQELNQTDWKKLLDKVTK